MVTKLIRNTPSGAEPIAVPKYPVQAIPMAAPDADIHRKIMSGQRLAQQALEWARCLVNQLRGDDPWRADKTRDAFNNLLAEIGAFAETNECEDALTHIIERINDGKVQGETNHDD